MTANAAIYGKVTKVLAESLNVDEDEVRPAATLQGDLGAESIDFLDIVFRLEREFGIRIPRGELFPESVFQGNPDFVLEGRVTDRGMGELRARINRGWMRAGVTMVDPARIRRSHRRPP